MYTHRVITMCMCAVIIRYSYLIGVLGLEVVIPASNKYKKVLSIVEHYITLTNHFTINYKLNKHKNKQIIIYPEIQNIKKRNVIKSICKTFISGC